MEIERIDPFTCIIHRQKDMRVPARLYLSEPLLAQIRDDLSIQQIVNVARLPGILCWALGMPDMHQGFAFPIGGVAAFDADEGVVSPGGVGFDINCGVRVLQTGLSREMAMPLLEKLGSKLFNLVPAGVGSEGRLRFDAQQARLAMRDGLGWAVRQGLAEAADRARVESGGCLEDADPSCVSREALERGRTEFGTLGAGNHFLEIAYVEKVFDARTASALGLAEDQVLVWIHTGSRGLGHQIATDAIAEMRPRMQKYGLTLYERDFVSLPLKDPLARKYLSAMAAGANFSWINRQIITHMVRQALSELLGSRAAAGISVLYDVAHNIAKFEQHVVDGKPRRVLVHRKGATRAFPSGHPELPEQLRAVGQPVLLPGDMLHGSYILIGTPKAMEQSFGSVAHGAGRRMSRSEAVRKVSFDALRAQMQQSAVQLLAADRRVACEEAPQAYKDVDEVVRTVQGAGLALPVARCRPLLVIKG